MSTIEILKRCEVFLGLDTDDLQKIVDLPSCQAKTYQTQEVIFRAGEDARQLYILEEGQVDLVMKVGRLWSVPLVKAESLAGQLWYHHTFLPYRQFLEGLLKS